VRRAFALAAILVAAAPLSGAAAPSGIGRSASPSRLRLHAGSAATITVRNPGARPLVVEVSRAGLGRSLRGQARIHPRTPVAWLRLRPRRLRLAPASTAVLHVAAASSRAISPGDHPGLVLLTTRPLGARHVRVRLRVGVVVVLHVRGRIVHRLYPRALSVERRRGRTLLELRLVNRGNVTEELGGTTVRIALLRGGRPLATLRPRHLELLPHGTGIAEFRYRGRMHGLVVARVLVAPQLGRDRSFRIRL
jgi:translation initiation factor IF-1